MSEYTKGNWEGAEFLIDGEKVFTVFCGKYPVATLSQMVGTRFKTFENAEENVKLITACPDMYEALKEAYEILSNENINKFAQMLGVDQTGTLIDAMRKAIAKAEGK
ncbi:MAG: hypothetical protein MJA83_10265 [Gammaproteobacteria bacterium]|nr:hypothetical protein [Gammaproteobacteria bacterium]